MIDLESGAHKSDEEIVGLVLTNQEYFALLISRYEDKLLRYIFRISGLAKEDAEDLLQNIFLKVYLNLNDFDQGLKFSSWIYRIAHNEVVSNFRKLSARPKIVFLEDTDYALNNLIADLDLVKETDSRLTNKNIYKIFNGMEEKYREVLVLKFIEEKDYREISDILKKPAGTIATLINRAKAKFREEALRRNITLFEGQERYSNNELP